jgi:DUF4097 and DUF4098 domain-containing protein YvlB
MGNDNNETTKTGQERREVFASSGPVSARIATKSGDIRVAAHDRDRVEVTLRAHGRSAEYLLEHAEIAYDEASRELTVRTSSNDPFDSIVNLKSFIKNMSWFEIGHTDVDVHVKIPEGSSLSVVTASGDCELRGVLEDVKFKSASGDLRSIDSLDSLEVHTASGDVVTGVVRENFRCRSASGDVRCAGAGTTTDVHTASGDVTVSADHASSIVVRAVSGDVRVFVKPGLLIDVDGKSVSGEMNSSIPLDGDDEGSAGGDVVRVRVTTVSGDMKIAKAS